jgi:uncharacterized oligopeptide transporter (OPT) family protein
MTTTGQPTKPWVLAGGLSFACLELVNLVYAFSVGSAQLSQQTWVGALMVTVIMGLFGLLVGLIFAKIRRAFGSLNPYVQGVLALVVLGAVLGIFTKGVSWFSTAEFAVSSAMLAGGGLLFAYSGLRLGAERQTRNDGRTGR